MNNVRRLRKELGISQTHLARELNVAQNTISQWETGKRDIDSGTLHKLAGYFGCSVDYLLGEINNSESSKNAKAPPTLEELLSSEGIDDEEFRKSLEYQIKLKKIAGNSTEFVGEFLEKEYTRKGRR